MSDLQKWTALKVVDSLRAAIETGRVDNVFCVSVNEWGRPIVWAAIGHGNTDQLHMIGALDVAKRKLQTFDTSSAMGVEL